MYADKAAANSENRTYTKYQTDWFAKHTGKIKYGKNNLAFSSFDEYFENMSKYISKQTMVKRIVERMHRSQRSCIPYPIDMAIRV